MPRDDNSRIAFESCFGQSPHGLKRTSLQCQKNAGPLKNFWAVRMPFAPSKFPIFYGWVIVFAATLGNIFSIPGQTMGFSVFTDLLMEELKFTRVQLSLAYCLGTVASGLTLPWLGKVLDRWGERKMAVYSVIATGLILFYLAQTGPFSRALGSVLPADIAAFLVIGIGFYMIRAAAQGVLSMTCRNAVGKWFDHQRGLALAISGVLVSFSYSLAPRGLDWLIQRYGGHEGAWIAMGVGTLVIMAPLAWLLFRDKPEDDGLLMDNGKHANEENRNPDMHIHREFTRSEAIRDYSFWIFNLTFSFFGLYATAVTFHILSLGKEYSIDREYILSLFFPIAVVSVITNLFFGAINARIRLKTLLLIMNLGCLSAVLGMLHLNHPIGIPAYVIGSGIAGGGFVSLSGIVFPRFYGREHLGAISGINVSSTVIASGLGPLLYAACNDLANSYRLILIASAYIPAALALLSVKADNPQMKYINT